MIENPKMDVYPGVVTEFKPFIMVRDIIITAHLSEPSDNDIKCKVPLTGVTKDNVVLTPDKIGDVAASFTQTMFEKVDTGNKVVGGWEVDSDVVKFALWIPHQGNNPNEYGLSVFGKAGGSADSDPRCQDNYEIKGTLTLKMPSVALDKKNTQCTKAKAFVEVQSIGIGLRNKITFSGAAKIRADELKVSPEGCSVVYNVKNNLPTMTFGTLQLIKSSLGNCVQSSRKLNQAFQFYEANSSALLTKAVEKTAPVLDCMDVSKSYSCTGENSTIGIRQTVDENKENAVIFSDGPAVGLAFFHTTQVNSPEDEFPISAPTSMSSALEFDTYLMAKCETLPNSYWFPLQKATWGASYKALCANISLCFNQSGPNHAIAAWNVTTINASTPMLDETWAKNPSPPLWSALSSDLGLMKDANSGKGIQPKEGDAVPCGVLKFDAEHSYEQNSVQDTYDFI